MIQISNLTKVYQKTLALDSVSFSFEMGKSTGCSVETEPERQH